MKNILNFETVRDFTSAYTGNPDAIPTPVPGVAYVRENRKVKYNTNVFTIELGYSDRMDRGFVSLGSGFTVDSNWDGRMDPDLDTTMSTILNNITQCEDRPSFCGYSYRANTNLNNLFDPEKDLVHQEGSINRIDITNVNNGDTIYYCVEDEYCK